MLGWLCTLVDTRVAGPYLTPREREVARLVGLGLTNREIGKRLGVSERTVGAHIQNILNKLGGTNRAQIAAWAAGSQQLRPSAVLAPAVAVPPARPSALPEAKVDASRRVRVALLVVSCVVLALLVPADRLLGLSTTRADRLHGEVMFQAAFSPDGHEFSFRYTFDDPRSSDIRFVDSGIEYTVLRPGGWTGNSLLFDPGESYFAEYEISAKQGSNATFWLLFNATGPRQSGNVFVQIDTALESMQLAYLTDQLSYFPLSAPVPIKGLLGARKFVVAALVEPPRYVIYLDGARVADVSHEGGDGARPPAFGIRADDVGTVRVSAVRLYRTL